VSLGHYSDVTRSFGRRLATRQDLKSRRGARTRKGGRTTGRLPDDCRLPRRTDLSERTWRTAKRSRHGLKVRATNERGVVSLER
jgi:hypothetical protein